MPRPSEAQSLGAGAAWMSCSQRGIQPLSETQVPKQRESEGELVALLSAPARSLMAKPNEMPSDTGAKMLLPIDGSLLWGIELSRGDIERRGKQKTQVHMGKLTCFPLLTLS